MFILDRKEAVIVITSGSLFHCNIWRADSILIAILGGQRSAVPGDAFTSTSPFAVNSAAWKWKARGPELFLWTLPLINEFLTLFSAFASPFLALGTSAGRGRGRGGGVPGLLTQGLGMLQPSRHQGKSLCKLEEEARGVHHLSSRKQTPA